MVYYKIEGLEKGKEHKRTRRRATHTTTRRRTKKNEDLARDPFGPRGPRFHGCLVGERPGISRGHPRGRRDGDHRGCHRPGQVVLVRGRNVERCHRLAEHELSVQRRR